MGSTAKKEFKFSSEKKNLMGFSNSFGAIKKNK